MTHTEGTECTGCTDGGLTLPVVALVGTDGNAFAIMGTWQVAARRAGWAAEAIQPVLDEAMAGDYDHLLQTIMRHSRMADDDEEAYLD